MPSDAQVQDAVAFLQKSVSKDGGSLYETLTKLVATVLDEKPANPVDLLETALLLRRSGGDKLPGLPVWRPGVLASAADTAAAKAAAKLYGSAEVPIDAETGEPVAAEPPNEYECEDVLADAALFEALGVGLGRPEMLEVALGVKRLGEDPAKGVAAVRFFGKFLGLTGDYWVFEARLAAPPDQPPVEEGARPGAGAEAATPLEWNTGANTHVYFVCSALGGPFTQLPHVTPAQIKAARQQKKLLTGRLSSQVSSYPVFPGLEAHYLRAQIARIAATSVACPAGLFEADEDGGLQRAEEWEARPAREMSVPSSWAHKEPHLKAQGRCVVHAREPPEDEEAAEGFELTEEEAEEGPELLAGLDGDKEVAGAPAWTGLISSTSEATKYQVAGLRSNQWPGSFCAAKGSHHANIYVGWGVKAGPFVPAPPPRVAREYDAALVESAELPPQAAPPAEGDAAGAQE